MKFEGTAIAMITPFTSDNKIDEEFLEDVNSKDPIFPEIDYVIFY